ncbi:MAG: hypothetical protein WCK78_14830 [Paludibacter sp.]
MKTKIILSLLFVIFCLSFTNAQSKSNDSESAKKTEFLPKAGEFGIGADATPVFNYIGNFLSAAGTNTLNLSSPVIYAKYYLSDVMAIRATLLVSSKNHKDLYYDLDDAARFLDPLSNSQVIDTKNTLNQQYFFSLAYQKFIGKNRLRGFYGVQVLGGYDNTKSTYVYGNPMSELNPKPTNTASAYGVNNERPLVSLTTNDFSFGGGVIAGFEYYIIPKLCIGAEASLNLIYTHGGQLNSQSERVIGNQVITSDVVTSGANGSSDFSIQTSRFTPKGYQDQLGFYVMLHF